MFFLVLKRLIICVFRVDRKAMSPLFTGLLMITFFSCTNQSPNSNKSTPVETTIPNQSTIFFEDLIGEWETVTITVNITSKKGKPRNEVTYIGYEEWQTKLQRNPVHIFFYADSTWTWQFYTLEDSLIRGNIGTWFIKGDSLIVKDPAEPKNNKEYRMHAKGDSLEFRTFVDWDYDGKEDDQYIGLNRRILNNSPATGK